ncbi:alpha-glucan phosphorylase [Candidatus Desantisbacteria bacterium CG_4_10_14_3_um_filter_40_18]|uniref:Alpha-glucan phosphorylase n=1 Tax=Candidatus Desantisbacteria bacterium CG_4_10_14_3_um_filter_40_18 TaxID=1974544 RepID=A0A2M7P3Y3_9BACT|nr:MAG: alpha-glucan phosphorylase [Candidatus Desantisbacteria bacterium CG_4_10_14_3_um_filter_40_18]
MPKTMELFVQPIVPQRIIRLSEIAYNFWFSWNPDALMLFSSIDSKLWEKIGHNPVKFLKEVSQHKLEKASNDRTYLMEYNKVMAAFDHYLSETTTWYDHRFEGRDEIIAYFSAEYGIHESLGIYSGGLGILSGDHCKAASDLGLPFVAIGFLYRHGYFSQKIDAHGNQIVEYIDNVFEEMPILRVNNKDNEPLTITVNIADRKVFVNIWEARIGRIPLYLLDADTLLNDEKDRLITYQLYGGNLDMRICQEIVLGMGGVQALRALDIKPTVWHMNEGHSVFMGLERIRNQVKNNGLNFHEALEVVRAKTVFTTHTPVPAGHDAFPLEMMDHYFHQYYTDVGLSRDEFMGLGVENENGKKVFNLTCLAFKIAYCTNAVSLLHGQITSKLWEQLWPGIPAEENPIICITNGIHTFTWITPPMADFFDQYLGQEWRSNLSKPEFWQKIYDTPDDIYWGVRQDIKRKMIEVIRANLKNQRIRNMSSTTEIIEAEHVLSPEALTIGFARRFATYKRANLIFKDLERLKRIVNNPNRPVQIVFAGKSHPADHPGQDIIRQIYNISQMPEFRHRIVLLEDYNINIARCLVSGVDVWLNTPRRPYEASGTSGQKVAVNGGINLSILDGWWAEGYKEKNGWAIGDERDYNDHARQDTDDSNSLYSLLEEEIIPLYYQKGERGYSPGWVKMSKESIKTIVPIFNTDRMVREYMRKCYIKASDSGKRRLPDNHFIAKELAAWKKNIICNWGAVGLSMPDSHDSQMVFGNSSLIEVVANLGGLGPGDVAVELYVKDNEGIVLPSLTMTVVHEGRVAEGRMKTAQATGEYCYQAKFHPHDSGRYAISIRIIPYHPELLHKHEMGLCKWL